MRLILARCTVDYTGRLTTHLPEALRLLVLKADGSFLVHSDQSSKALNYLAGPTTVICTPEQWTVASKKTGETLTVTLAEVLSDTDTALGAEPGLRKVGTEKELQVLLAERLSLLDPGLTLIRREYPTPMGPVDFLCRDAGGTVAVEIKRNATIDGVEQLDRYLTFLNRDPLLAPVRGMLAGLTIAPNAAVLATDRGIATALFSYDDLIDAEPATPALF